jgi:PKD repeat protein
VNLNASASKDEDGTITKYSWSTSNGQTAVGSTASLTFNQAGSHTITLTVTDDKGLTAQTRKTVTVNSPTQASQEATAYLINLSTRAPIEGGSGDVIAGFIITGAGKQKVLIRAFSIEAGVDPKLTVQKYPSGDMVASNDDWQDDPNIASKIKALPVHLRLTNDLDAGLLLELPAGAYTAILSSVGAKGIGLIGVDAID